MCLCLSHPRCVKSNQSICWVGAKSTGTGKKSTGRGLHRKPFSGPFCMWPIPHQHRAIVQTQAGRGHGCKLYMYDGQGFFFFASHTTHVHITLSLSCVFVCVSLVASSTIINQTRVSVLHDLRMHQCGDPTQDTPAAHNQSSERVPPCICTCQLSPVKFHTAKEWRVLATNHPHQTKPRHRVWAAPARHLVSK